MAAHIDAQVASAQRAHAREAHQHGQLVDDRLVGLQDARASGFLDICAKIDPPAGGYGVDAGRAARALVPQPVAHVGAGRLPAQVFLARNAERTDDVARQVAARAQQHIAAMVRVPGRIGAGRAAIDQGFIRGAAAAQHRRTVAGASARLIVGGIAQAGGGGARRIDAIWRQGTDVAGRNQVQVARPRAQHAEMLGRWRHAFQRADFHPVRRAGNRLAQRDAEVRVAQSFHIQRHRLAGQPGGIIQAGAVAPGIVVAVAGACVAPVFKIWRYRRARLVPQFAPERIPEPGTARPRRRARDDFPVIRFIQRVVAVRQPQVARQHGTDAARVGRAGIGAGHEPHRPRQRAFRQHGRDRPVTALHTARDGAQRHAEGAARQLDAGIGGDQRTDAQGQRTGQHDPVRLEVVIKLRQARQWHAGRPGQAFQRGHPGQLRTGAQLRAFRQQQRLARNQRAGRMQQAAGAVAHVRAQHRIERHFQRRRQAGRHRQHGAHGQRHRLDGQGIIQDLTGGKQRSLGQHHAMARHHHVCAVGLAARRQHPALVVRRGGRRRKTVVDAAKDVEIAARAQHQAARFARAGHGGFWRLRVQARIAVRGQVDVAADHQVALRDDFHAGPHMQRLGKRGRPQACQLIFQQIGVAQRRRHEVRAVAMLAIEVSLVDVLVWPAARRQVRLRQAVRARHDLATDILEHALWRIAVARRAVHGNLARAFDAQACASRDGDVAVRGRIGVVGASGAAQARRVQVQGAARLAVMPALARAAAGGRAVAHIEPRAAVQGQHAIACIDFDQRPVRRIDDLAVAVDAQHAAMRVEHGRAGQRHAMLARQADRAHALAAGVDGARHRQAAIVERDIDAARPDLVADGQIAPLDLETAFAIDLAIVQAPVQGREIAHVLRADIHDAALVGQDRATGVIAAAGAAQQPALQVDLACGRIEGDGLYLAALVVAGRHIDAGGGRLRDIAAAAGQYHLAAPAVFVRIVDADLASRHVQLRAVEQAHVASGGQGQFAARQHHGRIQRHAIARQQQFRAQRVAAGKRRRPAKASARSRDIERPACRDAVDGTGLSRQQRRVQVQVAACVGVALARRIGTLRLVHGQAALVVGRDALAGIEPDVGEAQDQALGVGQRVRARVGAITELDTPRVHVQRAAARAGAAGQHGAGQRCRAGRAAIPDEGIGDDTRRLARLAAAIHGRRRQRQLVQQRLAAGIHGAQGRVAVEIERLGGRQRQGLQSRRARAGIAAQQAVQDFLVQGQPRRQGAARGGRIERLRTAHVDAADRQGQVARAVAHGVAELEGTAGGKGDRAFRIQRGSASAGGLRASADADAGRRTHAIVFRRQHLQAPVGHGQHAAVAGLVDEAVLGIEGGLAAPQRADGRTLLDLDAGALVCHC